MTQTKQSAPSSRPNQNRKPTQRNKKFVPKAPAGPKQINPEFLYRSSCHGALGKKKPLTVEKKDGKSIGEGHLGVFRCSECNKHSVFTRHRNTEGELIAV